MSLLCKCGIHKYKQHKLYDVHHTYKICERCEKTYKLAYDMMSFHWVKVSFENIPKELKRDISLNKIL